MCGFAGVLGNDGLREDTLRGMMDTLHHRGPDDNGLWYDVSAGVGLVHTRLSILDLSCAGHQPMTSPGARYVMVFNGEIYNHLHLRQELERSGSSPVWRGHSDTETLLAGFDVWGLEQTITRTVGMFAFAVWDQLTRTLTLGRDRLGEKPLYYGWQGPNLFFGSELKALTAYPAFRPQIDRDSLAVYMRFGYIPGPRSIYKDVKKLPPGTLLTLAHGRVAAAEPVPYWSFLETARQGLRSPFEGSDEEAVAQLESVLTDAIALQQVADVPLGAFLSGGIDSSTIAALMQRQAGNPIHTFTIGFEEDRYNEAVYARAVAAHLGTHHTEFYVTAIEARGVIPRLPTLYDEPFADSSQIPTFLVSELARRQVTVSLSGDGGDELFGGYNRYAWARKLLRIPAPLRHVGASALTALSPARWDRLYGTMRPLLPSSLRLQMPGDKAHKLAAVLAMSSDATVYERLVSTWSKPDDLVRGGRDGTRMSDLWHGLSDLGVAENRMMVLDALLYLPDDILCKVDRAAMGVSLETRVPFLDHRVVQFAWQLPLHSKLRAGQGKWILRQLLHKYVPEKLVQRPKIGFAIPIDAWLRGPLREWAEELLRESRVEQEGYLNARPIRKRWVEHLSGRRNWQSQIWTVLMFQAWLSAQQQRT